MLWILNEQQRENNSRHPYWSHSHQVLPLPSIPWFTKTLNTRRNYCREVWHPALTAMYMHVYLFISLLFFGLCWLCWSLYCDWCRWWWHAHTLSHTHTHACTHTAVTLSGLSSLVFVVSLSSVDANMWTATVVRMRWMNKSTGLSLSACGSVYRQPVREFNSTLLWLWLWVSIVRPQRDWVSFFSLLHSPDYIFLVSPIRSSSAHKRQLKYMM